MTPDQYRREGAEAMRAASADLIEDECSFMSQHGMSQAIRAIDVDKVLAGLPTAASIGGKSVVEVCPICDIAGCRHIREAEKAPDALARIVEAARQRDGGSHDQDCRINRANSPFCDCGHDDLMSALTAIEKDQ